MKVARLAGDMKDKELLVDLLDRCLTGLNVEPKRLFGADGRAKQGKVFAMITKHAEFVIKCDDELHFQSLQVDGAVRWRPHPSRGPMGTWLVLTETMLRNENELTVDVLHSHDTVKLG